MAVDAGRSYATRTYQLKLAGANAGFVRSVEGGGVVGDVVYETAATGEYKTKSIGSLRYEDFAMQIGSTMAKSVYDWIADSWKFNPERMHGSVVSCDRDLNVQGEREFNNALITETTIPAMDASARDPCYITVRFTPESTLDKAASGKAAGGTASSGKAAQKLWSPANFRLEINGLDCARVSRIDSFSVKRTISAAAVGSAREYEINAGELEFPNLRILFAEDSAQSWRAWHKDFVIDGRSGEEYEKNGTLTFLRSNAQTELGRIELFNLGIFRLASEKVDAGSEKVPRVLAELYCERMEFNFSASQ